MVTREEDLERIIFAAHALARVAALETGNDTPAAQWRTLSILLELGRPARLGEIAMMSRVTQPGMTRLIGAMEDAGLVTRESDLADSRVTLVSVTEAGTAALDGWRRQLGQALAPRFADLDESEWHALQTTAQLLALKTGVLAEVAR